MDNTVQSTSEYVLGNWKYFTTNVPKIAPEMIRGLDYEIVSGQVQLLKQLHKKSEPKDKQEMVNALEAYLKL
ncbi:hypothetical protein FACS1894125_6870 [Actinomycetota bacterium]|nr:hypothetical protein FACS1894125_6870 [Actinomycetota bacterium]